MTRSVPALVVSLIAFVGPSAVYAQSASNLLLVVNSSSPTSEAVAKRYIAKRGVPQDNVCSIQVAATETITRDVYENQIEAAVWRCIAAARAQDQILYIVLTKDVPIRISGGGGGGRNSTTSSVDSELTLLYRRKSGYVVPVAGFVANPYFAGAAAPSTIKPFAHDSFDIYLVTRLDGFTLPDVEGLIDRGAAPVRDGRFVLDLRANLVDPGGDAWLRVAAERLKTQGMGERLVVDESNTVLVKQTKVLGYYSWGSNDAAFKERHYGMEFVPGALAGEFVSTDGRTFKEPPANWSPANVATKESIYGGSHQSLIGDLIRDGVTGVAGHVDEPFLDATIRPEILFPAYVAGHNLAEAYYAAMPYLSWQTVVIGDPLCAPFQSAPRAAKDLDPGFDFTLELPAQFGRRRLAAISSSVKREAAMAFIRYESRTERRDFAAAREALEAAVIADPRFTAARVRLAAAQKAEGQVDRAIAHWQAIVNYEPNNATVLNDLAYELATTKGKPQDALLYAERAATIAKSNPQIVDTLAWVQYLLGKTAEATLTIRRARALTGDDADILFHSALILAAAKDNAGASSELAAAVKANPELAKREDVKKLQQQLAPPK
jgi:uncharacterized protein (TIGR03790 family)